MASAGKRISLFSLVMINVIAVDSLRSLPFSAEYGFSLVFYYLLTTLFFFIPTALVSAELATGWPKRGGIYVWVKEAFGKQCGLMVIWLQWIYNICWYPLIMSFTAATIAYMIHPPLVHDLTYMLSAIFILFMTTTVINCFGMRASTQVTNVAAIMGSIVPMVLITCLGYYWVQDGQTTQVQMDWEHFIPEIKGLGTLALMTNILYSMVGMEMSAVHAQEVDRPQRSYPIALLFSTLIIVFTLVGGGLAIAIVVPQKDISLMTGMLDIFKIFFDKFEMPWMSVVIGICIVVGALGSVTAWIIGPSKGLMVAAEDKTIPAWFAKTNHYGAPVRILLSQAAIFSVISGIFVLMPSINSAYWILSNITAILSLIAYLFMFAAVVKLRYSHPDVPRAYTIPFGKFGLWATALSGGLMSLLTIVVGFFPPDHVDVGNVFQYELMLFLGVLGFLLVPFFLPRPKSK